MTESEFIAKIASDESFAGRVTSLVKSDLGLRKSITRSVIENIADESTLGGRLGESGSYLDVSGLAKKFNAAYPSLKQLGNPPAVELLREMMLAVERVGVAKRIGISGKTYLSERLLSFGPTGIALRGFLSSQEGPLKIRIADLVRATSDPQLAALLKEAAKTKTSDPAATVLSIKLGIALTRPENNQ